MIWPREVTELPSRQRLRALPPPVDLNHFRPSLPGLRSGRWRNSPSSRRILGNTLMATSRPTRKRHKHRFPRTYVDRAIGVVVRQILRHALSADASPHPIEWVLSESPSRHGNALRWMSLLPPSALDLRVHLPFQLPLPAEVVPQKPLYVLLGALESESLPHT